MQLSWESNDLIVQERKREKEGANGLIVKETERDSLIECVRDR